MTKCFWCNKEITNPNRRVYCCQECSYESNKFKEFKKRNPKREKKKSNRVYEAGMPIKDFLRQIGFTEKQIISIRCRMSYKGISVDEAIDKMRKFKKFDCYKDKFERDRFYQRRKKGYPEETWFLSKFEFAKWRRKNGK